MRDVLPFRSRRIVDLPVCFVSLCCTILTASLLIGEEPLDSILEKVQEHQLHGHIQFLADDLLEGRGPASTGDKLTQLYLETQFKALGLKPIKSLGSYRQPFPMIGQLSQPEKEWSFRRDQKPIGEPFRYFDDFIAVAGKPEKVNRVTDAEVVFVGYGIQAPEFDWDDYKNVDLRGKILLMMNNDPEQDPNLFAGARRLYYGRWDYKYESAARQGAAGAIIIHTDPSAGYPFSVIQTSWTGEEFELRDSKAPRMDLKAWMTDAATKRMVASAGFDLERLRAKAESRDFKPIPLGITLTTSIACEARERETANVLAVLPGTDPKLQDEVLVFMAHHDHIGIAASRDETGDTIYNGAIDNASGTAALLAIAEALVRSGAQPKRSILFAAVGAEEQGLLGSKYFAEHPPIPNGKLTAVINIDGLNFLGPTRDVQVIGFGKSSLDGLVSAAAQTQSRTVIPDREPSKGYYYRSDQFSLAKVGVPGLYLHSGYEVIGKPEGWGKKQLDAWTDRDYHQRSDEYNPDWDLSGAVQDIRLLLQVGWQCANQETMQSWNPGDEFELPRLQALEAAKE